MASSNSCNISDGLELPVVAGVGETKLPASAGAGEAKLLEQAIATFPKVSESQKNPSTVRMITLLFRRRQTQCKEALPEIADYDIYHQ